MNRIFLVTVFLSTLRFSVYSQESSKNVFFCGYSEKHHGGELCNYLQSRSFTSNEQAEWAVDKILEPLGLPRNFILVSCPGINNAVAVTPSEGLRYIIYDNAFMASIDRSSPDWAALSILAHEVGHHLCGHTLKASANLEEQRKQELEADEFSGFVMAKLGATLAQAQAAMKTLASDRDDTYSTHPNRPKRLAAIEKGYNKARGMARPENAETRPGVETLFSKAMKLAEAGDFRGAVEQYTLVLQSNPSVFHAYYNRALAKTSLSEYNGAIADFDKVIQINPKYANAFIGKGHVFSLMKNHTQAIVQYDQALKLDARNHTGWYNRGTANYSLGNYKAAIADYDKALQILPTYSDALRNRGLAKQQAGDQRGGQADINEAARLEGNRDATTAYAHYISGVMMLDEGKITEACESFKKGCQMGNTQACIAVTMHGCK